MQIDTHNKDELQQFAKRFLTGRINWWNVPRTNAITNYGTIIGIVLYRKEQFQVELYISPYNIAAFAEHTHPDVMEFSLTGDADLVVNGQPCYSKEDAQSWLQGLLPTLPIHIAPTSIHGGVSRTPYAFLSIQHWLNNVPPTSVGLNWAGKPVSVEQETLWLLQDAVDKVR